MNTKQIIDDFDEYGDKISKKLSASYWRPYFLIKEKFSRNEIDFEFIASFSAFYVMNGPMGLNDTQKNDFFRLLSSKENDLEKVLKSLYEILGYGGTHKLFLSFGTKLLHTIDNNLPIYDRNIASVLELTNQAIGTIEERIKNRIDIYIELKNNFVLLLKDQTVIDFLQDMRKEIHKESAQNNFEWKNSLVFDVKLLDSSLWALYTIRKELEENQKS